MDRRDFLKSALVAGIALPQGFGRGQSRDRRFREAVDPAKIPAYKFRILPVGRFPELQKEYDAIRKDGGLTSHKAFLQEVDALGFTLPKDFPQAKSVVVAATFAKTMTADFIVEGQPRRITVPPQYYLDGLNDGTLPALVRDEILKAPGARIVDVTERVPLKLLAARAGLGRYGRNNLIFVDGMGSCNLLWAFLTDVPAPDDPWSELEVLDACRHCSHCDRACPTACIPRGSFVIDAGRCLTLYNENQGKFPNFILPSMHHALMGCMRCQTSCPEDMGFAEITASLGEVPAEATRRILDGAVDDAVLASLRRTLAGFPALDEKEDLAILTRNLKALIRA
jgi:epoxyqueuosine reductase